MKLHTLPVKRRPAPKGIFKRLRAVTSSRKQRVAATASSSADFEDDGSSKISRALTIIFLIHIVAIGLLFVHWKFLDSRSVDDTKTAQAPKEEGSTAIASAPRPADLPRMAPGEKPYIPRFGDNYARIAAKEGVDENELRALNGNTDIKAGNLLKLPPKRITAMEPAEVTALRHQAGTAHDNAVPAPNSELVAAVDSRDAPKARVVKPNVSALKEKRTAVLEASAAASGKTYTVSKGDTVWAIAKKHKVSPEALMKLNNIRNASKLKLGATLSIPR